MQRGRRYRRILPPNANLNMQPRLCAPLRFVAEIFVNYFGVVWTNTDTSHSDPGIYVPTLLRYSWTGFSEIALNPMAYVFEQTVSPDGWHIDFELRLTDLGGNIGIYQQLQSDQDTIGWGTFFDYYPTPVPNVGVGFPFGNLNLLKLTPVIYTDEP